MPNVVFRWMIRAGLEAAARGEPEPENPVQAGRVALHRVFGQAAGEG
jgi:hypothetical protein